MTVTHHALVRNAIVDAVLAQIDIDAGAGYIELQTSGSAEAATILLSDPAGTVTNEVLTFSAMTDDPSAQGGTVSKFVIKSNGGSSKVYGSVAVAGGDINLSTLEIGATDVVAITSLTYTAPL